MDPCVLVSSTCPDIIPPTNIIKGILCREDLPEAEQVIEGIRSYPWHIQTKYYDAHVRICSMDSKTLGNQQFAESVNAVILCFDSQSNSGLETVNQWLSFTKEFQAEIQILICDRCVPDSGSTSAVNSISTANGITKIQAQKWCVKNGFELVELNCLAESDEDSELEDDFPESLGMSRVIQALHAHLWPNLILKDSQHRMHPLAGLGMEGLVNGLNGLSVNGIKGQQLDLELEEKEEENGGSGHHGQGKEPLVAKVKPMRKLDTCSDSHRYVSSTSSEVKPPSSPCLGHGSKMTCGSSHFPPGFSHGHSQHQPIAVVPPVPIPTSPKATSSSSGGTATFDTENVDVETELNARTPDAPINPLQQQALPVTTLPTRDQRIDSVLEAMEGMSEDSFEELFLNLSQMKSKASNLSPTQRKAYAEQMTMAFWRSMGGHEDEIDLSEDDQQ